MKHAFLIIVFKLSRVARENALAEQIVLFLARVARKTAFPLLRDTSARTAFFGVDCFPRGADTDVRAVS